ncbi:MAG: ATP-binding cassette domain-containing protein [Sphingobacteriales bacterium]|nr:MAG: ATP-binding cassette domain-containing protein [Sphingobacteriales bacterium]
MIEVQAISKQYPGSTKKSKAPEQIADRRYAVDQVSFTCTPGRIYSLLGPNGAGKTTTLRMIATLIQPTSGRILVNGYDTVQQSEDVRRRIGFLTGSTNLYDRMTPTETVKYFADLYRMPADQFRKRKELLFDQLGINSFLNKRISQLSTGMKQKVSIARTMIHDPDVVVFDEPTSGLDVITASSIIDLIRDCKAAGKTVIFSSHIMSEVDLLSDELAIINSGKIIYNDTMAQFRQEAGTESLTAAFIRIIQTSTAAL